MQETLSDIQKLLRQGAYKNEEHVRLSLVARIVQTLGWNIWNPSEVNTEFIAIPHEDKTRVDMALFLPPWNIPSVFIEIKAVGKIQNLSEIERQTRDYNRNNTAPISIITDGQSWKFYLSQTGGEFSQKRFLEFDLLGKNMPDDELLNELSCFLAIDAIKSGSAVSKAYEYLRRTQTEIIINDALLKAKKDFEVQYIRKSLLELFQARLSDARIILTDEDAIGIIEGDNKPPTPLGEQLPPDDIDALLEIAPINNPLMQAAHAAGGGRTRLKVKFGSGVVISEAIAADTFVKSIQELGIERVNALGKQLNNFPLISSRQSADYNQRRVGNYYVMTHSNTGSKKRMLEDIARSLGVNLVVEIIR